MSGIWRRLFAVALLLLLGAGSASARPFTVDDMLRTEQFGDVSVDPSGRWLAFAIERPLKDAPRFDMAAMDVLRSRLFLVDLDHPGAANPLLPGDAGAGTVVYGFSPTGRRLAIARLQRSRWQLGIVTLVTGGVRWFGVSPAYDPSTTTWAWISDDRLIAIVEPDGDAPWGLRANRQMFADLPKNWARTEAGRSPSVTVIGSGRYADVTPHAIGRCLLLLDATDGDTRALLEGDLSSVWLAPDRRHVAVIEQTGLVRLEAARLVAVGTDPRHHRLTIINIDDGRAWVPCTACDIISSAPAWNGLGDTLAFWARTSDQRWSAGALWQADLRARTAVTVDLDGFQPRVSGLPDSAASIGVGWRGRAALLYGSPPSDRRDDWYALEGRHARCLTCSLARSDPQLIATWQWGAVMIGPSGAWALTATRPNRLLAGMSGIQPVAQPDLRTDAIGLAGWTRRRGGIAVQLSAPFKRHAFFPDAANLDPIGVTANAMLVATRVDSDGLRHLVVAKPHRAPIMVATIDRSLASVDPSHSIPIAHRLPDGTAVTSWLYLPAPRADHRRPPLIVIPYPGLIVGDRPPPWDPGQLDTNVPALVGHGYAVLLPAIPAVDPRTRPADLTAQLLSAVDAVIARGKVDPVQLGLWGHSFGAFTAATIATQTHRFAAIVVASGIYDLASFRGSFVPWTRLNPGEGQAIVPMAGWTETGQPMLGVAPWNDPARYVAMSPLYHADRITTPMLIEGADADFAPLDQGEALFSALYRQGKDAELLTYWGEGHVLVSPANIRDFYARVFAWFDKHFEPRASVRLGTTGETSSSSRAGPPNAVPNARAAPS